MATDDYKSLREVSDTQRVAIEALVTGSTRAEAAERAGVHRVTVSKWATKHPGFQAEINRRRNEIAQQQNARLRELDTLALKAVESRLDASDPEFAMKWLKLRGADVRSGSTYGPTDPEEIIDELVADRSGKDRDAHHAYLTKICDGVDPSEIREKVQAELADDLEKSSEA